MNHTTQVSPKLVRKSCRLILLLRSCVFYVSFCHGSVTSLLFLSCFFPFLPCVFILSCYFIDCNESTASKARNKGSLILKDRKRSLLLFCPQESSDGQQRRKERNLCRMSRKKYESMETTEWMNAKGGNNSTVVLDIQLRFFYFYFCCLSVWSFN